MLLVVYPRKSGMYLTSQMQVIMEGDVHEALGRFLSYVLDARWFPERDTAEKQYVKAELLAVRRIIRRMEAFSQRHPDRRLERGLSDWKDYEQTTAQLAKATVRRSPYTKISDEERAEIEIAERLLCATLIIPKLWPNVSVYDKMRDLLAEPNSLPHVATGAEDSTKGLTTLHGKRLYTAAEVHYMLTGQEMPLRRYRRSNKALQSCVRRLQKKIEAYLHPDSFAILGKLYAEYVGTQWAQAGYSEAEAQMLRSLIPAEQSYTALAAK